MRLIDADIAVYIWTKNGCIKTEAQKETAQKLMDMIPSASDRDKPIPAVKSEEARYGMGYDYYDWICPTCGCFLAFEPSMEKLPRRCGNCGQSIKRAVEEVFCGDCGKRAITYNKEYEQYLSDYQKKYVENEVCPKCGGKLMGG